MSRLRSLVVLLAFASALAFGTPRAAAIDPSPNIGIATLASQHFLVHYSRNDKSTQCPEQYISQEQAGDVLGMAERAYALYQSWGYPAPVLDGDGDSLYDISVDQFTALANQCVGYTPVDPAVPRDIDGTFSRWDALINPVGVGAGEIHLDAKKGLSYHTIAHEVFHLFQLAMVPSAMNMTANNSSPNTFQWLSEGTAEWAAFRAESFLTPTESDLGTNPDRTADCVGAECGDTELDRNGYPGWLLFEYLSERYGSDAVKSVWDQAVANPSASPQTDLSNVLVAKGTTLSAFFNDYATARLDGNFTLDAIKGKLPATQASISTGDVSAPLPTTNVAVNHLAMRFVTLHHGASDDVRAPCYAATLALNIAVPAGVVSTPYFYANTSGSTPQAFTVSGSNASLTVPWNTCAGSPDALVSLPNDTWNPGLDGREFVITGTVTVDLDSPASPAAPSGTTTISTPVVVAPTTDPAPRLTLYAPEILRVSSVNRVLRFVVFSSGSGNLHATIGSTDLGTVGLRAGNNDVRFTLPKSLVSSLRKTASDNVLSLTSLSPSGSTGATVTRRVVIQTPKKKTRRR